MFKLSKVLTKTGSIVISAIMTVVFVIFLYGFLSADSFDWYDFGFFVLMWAGICLLFWAVFKILTMINSLGDGKK
ncbi:hypothetical protein DYBT9275_00895 [Dyadobacter sp. CECT 9275]|uniref:Uncharacterized protein n=1 Tax=Dyadobacter helix TaxID=2822344 RepID=A0A916NAQ7_9BACT|nr:hypothetical protein DYBT9275_00895 [Dyadobacter sp. CECT 9275]